MLLKVCQKTFLGILKISKFRVQRVCNKDFLTGESPNELRGGDHCSQKMKEKLTKVTKFIESLEYVESIYCRGKSNRQYLPSHLFITLLWRTFNNMMDAEGMTVKYEYFRKVFVENYNIGFGCSATDQCSKCMELKDKIKTVVNLDEKQTLSMFIGLLCFTSF